MVIQKLEDLQIKMEKQIGEDPDYPSDHPFAYKIDISKEKSSPDAPVIFG